MRLAALVMVLSVILAGCADSAPPPDDEEFDELDLEAGDGQGIIRGVVVDESLFPLPGATVVLSPGGQETVTTDNGLFGFAALEPGIYFLTVSKAGYATTQQSATVVAGEEKPRALVVSLVRVPGTEPSATYLQYQGYIGCAFKVANRVFPNSCAAVGDPDVYDILDFGTTSVPRLLQSEISWRHTQEIARQMGTIQYVEDENGERQRIGNVWGPSPLICRVTMEEQCMNSDGTGGGGEPLNETGFPGRFFASVYTACYPQCVIGAVGAGLIVQQQYDLYASAFFNWRPADDWTLSHDGHVEPPT